MAQTETSRHQCRGADPGEGYALVWCAEDATHTEEQGHWPVCRRHGGEGAHRITPRTRTLRRMADPGHSWVSVKRQLLHTLGIAEQISPYSYQRGQSVYLEEDADLARFLDAAESHGLDFLIVDSHTDNASPIRSYEPYAA